MDAPEAPPPPPPPPAPASVTVAAAQPAVPVQHASAAVDALAYRGLLFGVGSKKWRKISHTDGSLPASLSLVTFNVFFGQLCLEARARALLDIVFGDSASLPDIVCFQETTAPFLDIMMDMPVVQNEYIVAPSTGFAASDRCWYGVTMVVRQSLGPAKFYTTEWPSGMGRSMLSVVFPSAKIAISTGHFESLGSAPKRKKQLRIAESFGLEYGSSAHVVCGDFNFGDGMENDSVPPAYMDVWPSLHPDDAQALTWNNKTNPTIFASNPSDTWAARCDRVICKASDGKLRGTDIEMIGTDAVVPGHGEQKLCPSDHFGLRAKLDLRMQP